MKNMKTAVVFVLTGLLFLSACLPGMMETPGPTEAPPTPQVPTPTPTLAPSSTPEPFAPVTHPVGIRNVDGAAEFFWRESGETFTPRGTNYIHIVRGESGRLQDRLMGTADFDPAAIRANFARLRSLGYNTVRIFLDGCNEGPTCIANPDGPGLNPEYMDNVAEVLAIAKDEGLLVLFTSNDIPNGGGYAEISDRDPSADPMVALYRNGQMLTPSGHEAYRAYWEDIMAALVERRADFDAVLAWQLFNEQWLFAEQPPLSLDEGTFTGPNGVDYDLADPQQKRALVADAVALHIESIREVILAADPFALVTMGFFAPQFPNETAIGDVRFVDTAALVERDVPLDFWDIHAYPGDDLNFDQFMENFGLAGYVEKPVILGEYGGFESRYESVTAAARAAGAWMAGFCQQGVDGYLYWTLTDLPAELGDPTWGLLEQEGFMLDLFAPVNQPDPCIPPEVPSDNLAFGATVTASRSLPEEPPQQAVDENTGTAWGAGADPQQWIEVDLGAEMAVSEIRLLVSQFPEGETVHEIRVRGEATSFETVHRFEGSTRDQQWLAFNPETPLENVRFVRVYTLNSPSWVGWREVEIH